MLTGEQLPPPGEEGGTRPRSSQEAYVYALKDPDCEGMQDRLLVKANQIYCTDRRIEKWSHGLIYQAKDEKEAHEITQIFASKDLRKMKTALDAERQGECREWHKWAPCQKQMQAEI